MGLLYFLFFLIAITGILFHRSKIVYALLAIYIFIVMALNSYNPDYNSYYLIFENPSSAQEEIGYKWLCAIGSKMGLSYDQFHGIIVVLSLILLMKGIKKLVKKDSGRNNNFALASYMFFPMMLDVVLFRSFISGCIIIYSLHYLYEKKCWKYVIGVLLASLVHISSLFFLGLLLARRIDQNKLENYSLFSISDANKKEKRDKRRIAIFIIVMVILLVVLLRMNIVQSILLKAGVNSVKVGLWLSGNNITLRKIILLVGLHLVNFVIYRIIHREFVIGPSFNGSLEIDRIVYVMNYILLVNSIFTVYADQFLRILGVGIIVNSIYYSVLLNLECKQMKRWLYILLGITPAVLLFIFRMFAYQTPFGEAYFSYVFKCIIDNNFLLPK